MTITRRNAGKGHTYWDDSTGEKVRIPGVTTILKALPKDALINWAASTTADYALNNWDDLANKPVATRLKELNKARYADVDKASGRGTAVHKLAEKLVKGDAVKAPDEIAGHVQSYVRFLDDFNVQPIVVEGVVANLKHRYCGTLDLIADLDVWEDATAQYVTERWLIDLKTSRSGIFGETALQLAPYRYAEFYIDPVTGEELDVPVVDRCGAVHIRDDGYDLIPVEAEQEQFRTFLYVQQVARFVENSRDLVGLPIVPPTTSTFRLVSDDAA